MKKWSNKLTSDKCRRRADTVIRNRYKDEWRNALVQACAEGSPKPHLRADTIVRQAHRREWKIEHEKHAETIGYDTMLMKQKRALAREEARIAERKRELSL